MSSADYIFRNSNDHPELLRLQLLETIFDPYSRELIQKTGDLTGKHYLEVGAGAGSMLRWMAEQAGPEGKITAVDIDDRFLTTLPENVDLCIGDIRELALPAQAFDLIHVRYVLIHLPDATEVLSKLWNTLKPGGHLVIAEPDFLIRKAIHSTSKELQDGFDHMHLACDFLFYKKGLKTGFGTQMVPLIRELTPQTMEVVNHCPVTPGGSDLARMMNLSAQQLKEAYLSTELVDDADFEHYRKFTEDPQSWAIYYATIGVIAQK